MISFCEMNMDKCICHIVGNSLRGEGVSFSDKCLKMDELTKMTFLNYILRDFTSMKEYFNLYHEAAIDLNMVYYCVSDIFRDKSTFVTRSQEIARHLYEQSSHPKIREGEFYVVYLKDLVFNGETIDGVGLFRSERKQRFMTVENRGEERVINCEMGINTETLSRGCIIMNIEKDSGYVVAAVDNLNKSRDAHYWINDFLHVCLRKDDYYYTQNTIVMLSEFINKLLPSYFDISKMDQVILLNKTNTYLKNADTFSFEEYWEDVFEQGEVINYFQRYIEEFKCDRCVEIPNEFTLSANAVKRYRRKLKTKINLDGLFKIDISDADGNIQRGHDEEKGLDFYKIYFKNEN